jgi:hypothetical protein
VEPCHHELRHLKGPIVHPIKSQISLDHRWNESDKEKSKVQAVFFEKTLLQHNSVRYTAHMPCLRVRGSTLRRWRSAIWATTMPLEPHDETLQLDLPCLSQHAWLWGTPQGLSTHIICHHVLQLATRVSDPHSNTQRLPIAYSNHRTHPKLGRCKRYSQILIFCHWRLNWILILCFRAS